MERLSEKDDILEIELLYFEDCPSYPKAEQMIENVLKEFGLADTAIVKKVIVDSFDKAEELKFLGSPTIRVNGKDIDPNTKGSSEYELACRIYRVAGNSSGLPDIKWLKKAIGKAKEEDETRTRGSAKGKGRHKFGAKPLPKPKGVKSFTESSKRKGR